MLCISEQSQDQKQRASYSHAHRAAAVLPSTRHPVSIRALAILGYACHSTSAVLME